MGKANASYFVETHIWPVPRREKSRTVFAIIVVPVGAVIPTLPGFERITVNATNLERGRNVGTLVPGVDLGYKESKAGGEFLVK